MSRCLALLLCLALLVVPCASPVLAADAKDGKAAHHEPTPFDGALDLSIWTWLVFLLLFLILRKFAWGPMLEGLKKREETIHHAMNEAQLARAEAEKLRSQFQAEIAKANDQVRELLDEARRDAQHTKDEMLNQARAEIQSERDRLRREIDMTRDQALQDLWNRTAELATMVSSKAVRRQMTQDDHRRLVDEALAELRKAGTEWQKQAGGLRA